MYNHGSFSIFGKETLQNLIARNNLLIRRAIEEEPDDYILNVNKTEYINNIFEAYSIMPLYIDFPGISVSSIEEEIDAESFPHDFFVMRGEKYKKPVFVYHIPYSGNEELLRYRPSTYIMWTTNIHLEAGCLIFKLTCFRDNTAEIIRESEHIIENLKKQFGNVQKEVENYNKDLPIIIEDMFNKRKQDVLKKNKMLASLGVPIRKKEDMPQSFAIPAPEFKKKITVKPRVTTKGYQPEPTLDDIIYKDILQLMQYFGKQLERLPSTYKGKSEEDIRDHFLIVLESHYEGSATGETFNKSGKTDILLRHEGKNAFIAEFKFWNGKKQFLDAITQLLSYLTWRDSKAAIILLVKTKELSPVLRTVKEEAPNHGNYLGFVDQKEESWLNYRFHIDGDNNREVKLAILLFHIPT